MKKVLLLCIACLLLISSILYAANGDLVVNGKLGVGTSSPNAKLDVKDGCIRALEGSSTPPSSGAGVELLYANGNGNIVSYDRSNALFKPLYVYGSPVVLGPGNVGIGINPSYTLDINGVMHSAYGVCTSSDSTLKKNIQPMNDSLNKVLALNGVSYEWKRSDDPEKDKNIPNGRHYGVIAQEIEKVLPEVVNTPSGGTKAVAYEEIIPVLIEAIKEQQKAIEQQKKDIEQLKSALSMK